MEKLHSGKELDHAIEALLKSCRDRFAEQEIIAIQKAIDLANSILGTAKLPDGQLTLLHSLGVAQICCDEIGLGAESVISSVLHNCSEKALPDPLDLKIVEKEFGVVVFSILEGLGKINSLNKENIALQSENFRKLMMALSGDIRVILVKIADQLQDMRNLQFFPQTKKELYAHETSFLYSPFAHRLGLYKVNSELQDLTLLTLRPDEYAKIKARLDDVGEFLNKFVSEFVKPIETRLQAMGFNFEMKARTKSIYSIWNKLKNKNIDFAEIYDIFAIRVILNSMREEEKSDCWRVFSVITEHYQANPNRTKDWITIPKSNGYESLHTTVLGPGDQWVEVQIRTQRMNDIAENGLAAHWRYKGGKDSGGIDDWLKSIREILENPTVNPVDFIDEFKTDVYDDEIFVFTPKGDLRKLKAGSSLLDFAYEIHSAVGDKCTGGMVNDKKVTIRHKLKNGDHISVETSNNQKPKIDWLDIVVTSKAKSRLKHSLNEEKRLAAEAGKELLKRKFKNWKIEYSDRIMQEILDHLKIKFSVDLYADIDSGKIDPLTIKEIFTKEAPVEEKPISILEESLTEDEVEDLIFDTSDDFLVIDNNISNVNYKLAKCCNPILGDNIFGFVTIKEGIKIHRDTCPNAPQMKERYPYRVIKTKWKQPENVNRKKSFQATLQMIGNDHPGIVGDISHIVAKDLGVQMRSINVDSKKGQFTGSMRVFVNDLKHLEFLMQKIKNIKGMQHVFRTDA